jgi:hypothetical protein
MCIRGVRTIPCKRCDKSVHASDIAFLFRSYGPYLRVIVLISLSLTVMDRALALLTLMMLTAMTGCHTQSVQRRTEPLVKEVAPGDDDPKFLKAHMQNGSVYVLSDWRVTADSSRVRGTGRLLDLNRTTLHEGKLSIPMDSVALFETNTLNQSGSFVALTLITGASLALTGYCAVQPKACFGSCPTFYLPGDTLAPRAEGFSSSIAPTLEARDADALSATARGGDTLRVTMKNEALETHVVRSADLLAVPSPEAGRVLATPDESQFWRVRDEQPPAVCSAPEGDCRAALAASDDRERFSRADSTNLAAKETIEMSFERPLGPGAGLVIEARQTLLPTFLMYQTLAYMGRDAGRWLALLERQSARLDDQRLGDILGGIEVLVPDDSTAGGWRVAGSIDEHGPLATDAHIVPLPDSLPAGARRIRLRLTKGAWRLDHVTLARRTRSVEPSRLAPTTVLHAGNGTPAPEALEQLRDSSATLTTRPGDAYALRYVLPPGSKRYDLFLSSQGYYLEWIREQWLDEENQRLARQMVFEPEQALRRLAPVFKRVEPQMEDVFWNSRYTAP